MFRNTGINRNILECKCGCLNISISATKVLIETYWNVNSGSHTVVCSAVSINRNILECKCFCSSFEKWRSPGVLIETYWNVNRLQTISDTGTHLTY